MDDIEALKLFEGLSGMAFGEAIPEATKKDIERLYRYCFGKPLRSCNCKSIHSDAFIEIKLFFKRTGTMKDSRKYVLKRGVVIQMPGTTDVYTRDNITDEVSKAYLANYPKRAILFEKIPNGGIGEASGETSGEASGETSGETSVKREEKINRGDEYKNAKGS